MLRFQSQADIRKLGENVSGYVGSCEKGVALEYFSGLTPSQGICDECYSLSHKSISETSL